MKIFLSILISVFCFRVVPLFAQSTNLDGYNLQYLRPSSDGDRFVVVTGSKTLGHLKSRISFLLNGSRGHLSASNALNNRAGDVVDALLTGDFLFALGVTDFMNIGVDIPVHFYERGMDFNNATHFETSGVGDLRVDLKIRLLKEKSARPGIAFLSSLYAPAGETSKFTGYKKAAYEGRLILDKKADDFYFSANIGYRLLPHQDIVNLAMDDELTFGLGGHFILPVWDKSLELFSEVFGSAVVSHPSEKTAPLEILGGFRKRFGDNLSAVLAGGTGLTRGAGAPQYRALAGLAYTFGNRKTEGKGKDPQSQTIFFDFARWTVKPAHEEPLREAANDLQQKRNIKVVISGHTDSSGPRKYNRKLSEKRAMSIKKYLTREGVDGDRMIMNFFGETQPYATNKTREGRAKNRRVEVLFSR